MSIATNVSLIFPCEMQARPKQKFNHFCHTLFTNLQYDQFQSTKEVLKAIQHEHEERFNNTLLSQDLVILSILKLSYQKERSFGQLFNKTYLETYSIFQ